jgi:predicted transcriptional regulator
VRLDAAVVAGLKEVAARRRTTVKALIEQALYDSFGRLPEVRAVRGPANQVTR